MRYFDLPKSSGVYLIENHQTGYLYIGSSSNMFSRGSKHFHDLKNLKHVNRLMQSHWNQMIEPQFSIRVLEHCHAKELRDKEQAWIDRMIEDQKSLYNRVLNIPDREYKAPTWKGYKPIAKMKRKRSSHSRKWY